MTTAQNWSDRIEQRRHSVSGSGVNFVQDPKHEAGLLVEIRYLILDFLSDFDILLKEFVENRDKIEVYLAFGASRLEACRPIAKQALRVALTPMISQMSVIGMISIPGTMTGSILGGASVIQAARLQMVLMFLISSAVVLSSIVATGLRS